MHTIAQKYYAAIKQGLIGKVEIVFCPLQLRLQHGPRCIGRLDTAAATSCAALGGGNVSVPRVAEIRFRWKRTQRQFTSSRSRSSRARISMVRIFSAAGFGTLGTDMASSQESSMAVSVSLI